ncbi:Putative thioesterase [Mycobacteroides abscessus subsp. abscessus]|uniref:thioesterase II family protein n=1 Tax=Mycobacteroides abscessus TaxID=36809 RepID=UPI000929ECF5|nr:alpha/beta fold hydrolase [Mycobacteroides abscessus]SHR53722.1 Putative thioesterase [Mycobacteroides abscessus subsp. abscessus]SLG05712.1 Putative thioesterase [Mycobacteroides abscessus subsp. abscessus]
MTRLLCFHHAGGAATAFRSWQNAASPALDVVPVALPTTRPVTGRRIHRSTSELIDHLLAEYAEHLREPYVLYGHSMGGLLAYLMARRLVRNSAHPAPAALIVAASWSPRMRPSIDVDSLEDRELVQLLNAIGGVPADLVKRPEWLAPMLPVIRDDLRMCGVYEHDHVDDVLNIPVHVIGAEGDRLVTPEQTAGWVDLGERVSIEYHAGGHFFEADPLALRLRVFALAAVAAGEQNVRAVS